MIDERFRHAVAVIGYSGRFPGAANAEEFWGNIRAGVESVETWSDEQLDESGIPPAVRADPRFVRKGCVLPDADRFDAAFFGYSPREAQIIDPQQRVFLESAWSALEHAGYAGHVSGTSVGVYAGSSMPTYFLTEVMSDRSLLATVGPYQLFIGNDKDFLCTRVSYELDLRGPSVTIQTACSTSLVAVQVAYMALRRGECDLALAGGVSIMFPEHIGYAYSEGMIFSPDGRCRPFDANARGTRPGPGVGIVVLKRYAEAVADGDRIHAIILGAATNNDGAAKAGFTAPSVDGQVEVIATAHAVAGVDARSISYIETHGTGTPLGDPIEIAALRQVFTASTNDTGFCRLGAVKANIGHLDAAAGIAGLIKTILALEHRELPPLVNFEEASDPLGIAESPFVLSNTGAEWTASGGPLRAGVSAFGIGGTNAHVVLEEAPVPSPTVTHRDAHLIILSARTPAALDAAAANLAAYLHSDTPESLADVAYTLQLGRAEFAERRTVIARDTAEAAALLTAQALPGNTGKHRGGPRPVAFLFSGQGSQHPRMSAALYGVEPAFRHAFDRCAEILASRFGMDARAVLLDADAAAMNATAVAQPMLFSVEYALASLWNSWGVTPAAMLGHSIGEYVAAHLAGVMSLEDALFIVTERGRLMQLMPQGSMLAVQLPESEVQQWLAANTEIAAINAPEMCTVSGATPAIAALAERLVAAGVTHRELHTSHAFHSAMMDDAIAPFTDALSRVTLHPPTIPYVSNVTGTWITDAQATSAAYYATHLRNPVRFAAGVRTLTDERPDVLLETGPGTTLAGLARMTLGRDAGSRVVASLSHPAKARLDTESVLDAVGKLWVAGVHIDWKAMHANEQLHRVPLPTYPFERQRYRVGRQPAPEAAEAAVVRPAGGDVPGTVPRPVLSTSYEAPVTDTERRIAEIWTELLGIDNIGRRDRFFELGGDSLLATRVVARLRLAFGRDVDAGRVFALQTIVELAELVDGEADEQRETLSF